MLLVGNFYWPLPRRLCVGSVSVRESKISPPQRQAHCVSARWMRLGKRICLAEAARTGPARHFWQQSAGRPLSGPLSRPGARAKRARRPAPGSRRRPLVGRPIGNHVGAVRQARDPPQWPAKARPAEDPDGGQRPATAASAGAAVTPPALSSLSSPAL